MVPDGKLFVLRLRRTDVQIVSVDINDYDQPQELRERERERQQTDGVSILTILYIADRSILKD